MPFCGCLGSGRRSKVPPTGALCVSSQIGCTLSCRFCYTGTQGLVRNLAAGEIVGQVMLARDALGEWPSPAEGRMLSNIVVMGMGEPLYNFEAIAQALAIGSISYDAARVILQDFTGVPAIVDLAAMREPSQHLETTPRR